MTQIFYNTQSVLVFLSCRNWVRHMLRMFICGGTFTVKVTVGGRWSLQCYRCNRPCQYCVEVPWLWLCLHNLALQSEETLSGPVVFSRSLTKEFNTITAPLSLRVVGQVNPGVRLALMAMEIILPTYGDIVDQTVHFLNKQQIQLTQPTQLLQQRINFRLHPLL